MTDASIHPIDIDALNKGDYIAEGELAEIFRCRPGSAEWAFALLALKSRIEHHRRENNEPIVLKAENNGLRVLTDREASLYSNRQCSLSVRRLARNVMRLGCVDTSDFTEKERRDHERRIEVQSRTLQGAELGRRGKLPAVAYHRTAPPLIRAAEESLEGRD